MNSKKCKQMRMQAKLLSKANDMSWEEYKAAEYQVTVNYIIGGKLTPRNETHRTYYLAECGKALYKALKREYRKLGYFNEIKMEGNV